MSDKEHKTIGELWNDTLWFFTLVFSVAVAGRFVFLPAMQAAIAQKDAMSNGVHALCFVGTVTVSLLCVFALFFPIQWLIRNTSNFVHWLVKTRVELARVKKDKEEQDEYVKDLEERLRLKQLQVHDLVRAKQVGEKGYREDPVDAHEPLS